MMHEALGAIIAKAESHIRAEEGDYIGDDGYLYCGKCKTRKQRFFDAGVIQRKVMCLCKCEAERLQREEEERERRALAEKIARYRMEGLPEQKMHDWTFANTDGSNAKLMAGLKRYADNFDEFYKLGKGLILCGTVGTGKTYGAACIANALIDKGIRAKMTKVEWIANAVLDIQRGKQEYLDSFRHYPLLILDDIAAERDTAYMQEIVYNVIDGRYTAGRPLIATTNLTPEQLMQPKNIGEKRIYSRILEMCVPVEVVGEDKRFSKASDNLRIKQSLGL
ncbi:MAG: ATP-binding protein [Clostridia bacterium]|nr:ATP-binding protein [Clostridia bacterium]